MSQLLGGLSQTEFLNKHWQKQPLLVRNAMPGFTSPLSPNELAGLSLEEDIESRLVIGKGNQWQVEHGPFGENRFDSLPDKAWTLLVQGVDLWIPEVNQLIDYFDFIPRWRIDDIMASYATPEGSVGPHFDYYDVFLIQGAGQRRWEIGALCNDNDALLENVPLKILADFSPEQSWVLNPGDMLYLPPCVAHHGVALDDQCITYSVGFRAPTASEMLNDLALEMMSHSHSETHLTDPPLNPDTGNRLPESYIDEIRKLLLSVVDNREQLEDWFARYMTRPKNPELFAGQLHEYSRDQLIHAVNNGTIAELIPDARVMKTRTKIYLNGDEL